MNNPFFSKAIFSWNVPGVDGGDPNKFADRLKTAGFEAVYLKMANGNLVFKPSLLAYPTWGENVRQALVDALRARGIKVIGWQFNYGVDIPGEAAVAIAQSKRFNVDGWVFDVEGRFESNTNAVQNAYTLTSAYRAALPDMPLAFCSWAQWRSPNQELNTLWHNERMASAFMERCDVGMPMMYWEGSTPSTAVWLLNESVRLWQNVTNKPLIPTGRAYTGDGGTISAAAITAFADAARAKGMKGLSWWVLDSAVKDSAAWGALAAIPGLAPVVTPPVVEPPAVDPHIAQLANIYGELVDLRARVDTDHADRQAEIDALITAANGAKAENDLAYAAFVRELDYITNLSKAE